MYNDLTRASGVANDVQALKEGSFPPSVTYGLRQQGHH